MTWPFGDLKMFHYRVILADPPWLFKNRSAKGEKKNPNQHYECMTLEELSKLPIGDLAHPDGCALMLWATSPLLDMQIERLKRWGFTYKAAGSWGKRSKTGRAWSFGPGYILRSTAEFWLVGTIGEPHRQSRSVRNFFDAPVREHSRKPEKMRAICEELWEGPRCELFARERAPGWDVWGAEVDRFVSEAEPKGNDDGGTSKGDTTPRRQRNGRNAAAGDPGSHVELREAVDGSGRAPERVEALAEGRRQHSGDDEGHPRASQGPRSRHRRAA